MKLTKVEIKNYRSIFEVSGSSLCFHVGSGMNALVGPNNCGKSNVFRAIQLALDGADGAFDHERDKPSPLLWARPTITLDFEVTRRTGPVRTLLQRLEEYEQSALQGESKSTLASKGRIRLRVQYTKSGRDEFFLTSAGSRRGAAELNARALEQFRSVVRFISVRSGESVEEFLAGRFNDLLRTVIEENLWDEVRRAESRRDRYRDDVARDVFGPVSELVAREISQLVPEIQEVQIEPRVLGIVESLASAGITLQDAARTGLADKGTGVRGTLLLAMLRYIAEHSRRSVIFAIEEPEAFLHPAAQAEVRDDLESLAERDDVTLLVTTHSPFVVSRAPDAVLIGVSKDENGRTYVSDTCAGDGDSRGVLGPLFSDASVPDYLHRAAELPVGTRAVVVVEGYTDARYLQLAHQRLGRNGRGIFVLPSNGAKSAAVQAILLKVAHAIPVIVLLDYERETKSKMDMLRDTFGFPGEAVFTYRGWGPAPKSDEPVEAEGLFPQKFLERFLRSTGEATVLSEKVRGREGWRYGFNQVGKSAFLNFVEAKARRAELGKFGEIWDDIENRVEKLERRDERSAERGTAR
jgi:putative ATP-dependent endonuclease of OLD family